MPYSNRPASGIPAGGPGWGGPARGAHPDKPRATITAETSPDMNARRADAVPATRARRAARAERNERLIDDLEDGARRAAKALSIAHEAGDIAGLLNALSSATTRLSGLLVGPPVQRTVNVEIDGIAALTDDQLADELARLDREAADAAPGSRPESLPE